MRLQTNKPLLFACSLFIVAICFLATTGGSVVAQKKESQKARNNRHNRASKPLDFTLPSIKDNRPIRLKDYRGKKVLLVYFASW